MSDFGIQRKSIEPMEDDEDLELLRLAALKSLKKDTVPPVSTSKSTSDGRVIPVVGNVRPTTSTVTSINDKFYPETDLIQPNIVHHPVPPYVSSGFEKMEIGEPYLPQRLNAPPFNEYVPQFGVTSNAPPMLDPITNVQLSPRTAAFVYENKQIIQRRQVKSPSHSPVPFRKSPGRWSRSPSPENWKYRRSPKSRSPSFQNHSPQRRRHSPQPLHNRRNRTRSPNGNNAHRTERRSPIPNRRANSPNRQMQRPWHGHPSQRDNGMHSRKSGSPRTDELNHRRRRTRSPTKLDVRRRSSSRSPNRKYPRTNLNRPPRRSPPSKRFNNSNNKAGHNGPRNRNNHNQRNGSPSVHHRSHSPSNHHRRRTPNRNTMENGSSSNKQDEKDQMSLERNEQQSMDATSKDENNENTMNEKAIEQNGENELHESSESENSDSDNDNDGIDLFASEESESENEGRFKLSSRNERKTNVPTVSFSELGKTTTAPAEVLLRDLDELQTDSNRRGPSRRDNDRDRSRNNRRDDRRYNNRDRNRENKDREREKNRDRDRTNRERESSRPKSTVSWKSSKNEDNRRREDSSDVNAKNERKHFKSTFSSIDSERRNESPDGGKPSKNTNYISSFKKKLLLMCLKSFYFTEKHVDTKLSNEKRSTIQLKRSTKSSEKSKSIEIEFLFLNLCVFYAQEKSIFFFFKEKVKKLLQRN